MRRARNSPIWLFLALVATSTGCGSVFVDDASPTSEVPPSAAVDGSEPKSDGSLEAPQFKRIPERAGEGLEEWLRKSELLAQELARKAKPQVAEVNVWNERFRPPFDPELVVELNGYSGPSTRCREKLEDPLWIVNMAYPTARNRQTVDRLLSARGIPFLMIEWWNKVPQLQALNIAVPKRHVPEAKYLLSSAVLAELLETNALVNEGTWRLHDPPAEGGGPASDDRLF